MEKVKLWYQCSDGNPIWSFGWDAAFGALQESVPIKQFERAEEIPGSPYNIVVASVEETGRWLKMNGYNVPTEIEVEPDTPRKAYSKSTFLLAFGEDEYPVFIKPKGEIKAFTGTVVKSRYDAELVLNHYEGDIWVYKEIVNFASEWRCYINKGRIIKICHYAGEPLFFPDPMYVAEKVEYYTRKLNHNSFTIDFGVKIGNLNSTRIIEGNDAWAIFNYGLDPFDYFKFLKDRWFQITELI